MQLRFALRFAAVAAALFSIYAYPYPEHGRAERWFGSYLHAYARLGGAVISVFDRTATVTGNVIAGRFSLSIVKTCDAMEANLLFIAAVVAFPGRWTRRLVAAAAGVAALVVLNVTRICSLYFVGVHAPSAFELLHIEIWPLLLVVAAAIDFGLCAWWMARPSRARLLDGAPVSGA